MTSIFQLNSVAIIFYLECSGRGVIGDEGTWALGTEVPQRGPGAGWLGSAGRDAIYNGTGNSVHYRLAYADFRSGAWTVAPCRGE